MFAYLSGLLLVCYMRISLLQHYNVSSLLTHSVAVDMGSEHRRRQKPRPSDPWPNFSSDMSGGRNRRCDPTPHCVRLSPRFSEFSIETSKASDDAAPLIRFANHITIIGFLTVSTRGGSEDGQLIVHSMTKNQRFPCGR